MHFNWTNAHLAATLVPLLTAILTWLYLNRLDISGSLCWWDVVADEDRCRPRCAHGYFSLPGMATCRPWLDCEEISNITIYKMIGQGAVKQVFLGNWQGRLVAYSVLATERFFEDFQHGLKMLQGLQPAGYITQLIGVCGNSFVTEFYQLGSAEHFNDALNNLSNSKYNTLEIRLGFCIKYADIINFLHSSPLGTRVMCDSNDLQKTLNQYLLTSDLGLVANDLDALPLVEKEKNVTIKCGHRELFGDFIAPEQLWPFPNTEFADEEMLFYDERTDIWKIPDVCDFFLGDGAGSDLLRFHLFSVHKKCKQKNPDFRPSASEVVKHYKRVLEEMLTEK